MLPTAGRERSIDIFQHMRVAPADVCITKQGAAKHRRVHKLGNQTCFTSKAVAAAAAAVAAARHDSRNGCETAGCCRGLGCPCWLLPGVRGQSRSSSIRSLCQQRYVLQERAQQVIYVGTCSNRSSLDTHHTTPGQPPGQQQQQHQRLLCLSHTTLKLPVLRQFPSTPVRTFSSAQGRACNMYLLMLRAPEARGAECGT
jgi:hypothetical protein